MADTPDVQAPPTTPDNGGGTPGKVVAYENFQAVVSAKSGLESQVRDLKAQVQALTEKAATVDTLSGQLTEWKSKAEAASAKFGVYTDFSGALGTTDSEVIDLFAAKYEGLPKTDRPDRKAWVASLRENADSAPALLRPWLAPQEPAPKGDAPASRPAPRVPGTPATPPGAPAQVSAEAVAAAREKGVRTGNWADYLALSRAMGIRQGQ